jgi:hypothetical protein
MSVTVVPVICNNCGALFPYTLMYSQVPIPPIQMNFKDVTVGPCTVCGVGSGAVPDGLYNFTDSALTIFSTWSTERLQRLRAALEAARMGENPREVVEEVLKGEPELEPIWQKLSPIRDGNTFYVFIGVILMTITLLVILSTSGGGTTIQHQTVNVQTVIQHCLANPTASNPGR